jgi:hypothetical protein
MGIILVVETRQLSVILLQEEVAVVLNTISMMELTAKVLRVAQVVRVDTLTTYLEVVI